MKIFSRNYDNYLAQWKNMEDRLPLLIGGARQVGKSSVVKKFGEFHYENIIELNFMKEGEKLQTVFAEGLSPNKIIENTQLVLNKAFDPETDLLVFEEVGFSQNALTSLKFFAEDAPHIHIIATGSNVGLFKNFPVGKVERMTMYPLTFREFLSATDNDLLVKYTDTPTSANLPEAAHKRLMEELINYWFVGGMPAAINAWNSHPEETPLKRIKAVERAQSRLLADYRNDFGKFSNEHNATPLGIKRIYDAIASKIADVEDGNIPKFKFKGVLGNTSVSYEDIVDPVDFLQCLKLVHKVHILDGVSQQFSPTFQRKENMFKLQPHDVGLLTRMARISYQDIKMGIDNYKGFIAEVFVLNEFVSTMVFPEETELYTFRRGNSMEIEFLLKSFECGLVPIEVKSGKNTKSASLTSFVERYKPQRAFKFSAKKVDNNPERVVQHLPLYLARAVYVDTFRGKEDII